MAKPPAATERLKAACALLEAGGARGTGFLVSPQWLLTCYHVVRDAGAARVVAGFPHGQREATVELVDEGNDCALLRLTEAVAPGDAHPLPLSTAFAPKGAAWDGYGFPAVTGQAGLLIDGQIQDPCGQDPRLRPAVVLRSANITAGSWLSGFSGSPVVLDGAVIGQMRQIIPDAAGGAQMAVLYACPAAILADVARQRIDLPPAAPGPLWRGQPANLGPQPVYHVPLPAMPHFTGRAELLTKLREELAAHRMVALWGLGGIGKTQIAVAFAGQQRAALPVILCLTGDSSVGFEQGLLDLGEPLARAGRLRESALESHEPAAIRQLVRSYLREASDYLLVCDNVDEPLALRPVWPRVFGGQVLLTSRSREVHRLGAVVVEVGKLSGDPSRAYLRACHPPSGSAEQAALTQLAQELDGLPLALAQAAAFLSEHQSRYVDYLAQYRKQRLALLEQGLLEDYPHSVATTWTMSIEQIERAGCEPLDLLQLCAVLHPDAIPEELLLGSLPPEGDVLALDRMLKSLVSHALLQRDRENRSLSLHRLVQQVLLRRMPAAQQGLWVQTAWARLEHNFPYAEYRNWALCRRLLPHVEALSEHTERLGLTIPGAARTLEQAGYYLMVQGQLDQAEPMYRRALAARQTALGADHPEVAATLNNLARFLRHQGNFAEGEQLCRRALAIQEKALGREHPEVAPTLNNLGKLLYKQGCYPEAEPFYRRALAIREQQQDGDPVRVAAILKNLGMLLHAGGRLEEAEPLLRRALAIWEQTLGDEHIDVATALFGLGTLLHDRGQRDLAEPLLHRALAIREHALPVGHYLIETTRGYLTAHFGTGRQEPARD